jgi:hypothetical protein
MDTAKILLTILLAVVVIGGMVAMWTFGHRRGAMDAREFMQNAMTRGEPFRWQGQWFVCVPLDSVPPLVPEAVQQFHADAVFAWLEKMGVTMTSTKGATRMDVVRAVMKSVMEARP